MEGLQRCRTKFTVELHPSKLASAAEGVRAHLSSLLLRYNDDLDGVLLSYTRERVLTRQATIHPYFPFVRVEVAADVVLFRPRRGMRLVGVVNKVGTDYVGLLLLGFINVSLAADQIRSEFRARPMEHCWVSSRTPRHRIEVGTKVHFTVAAVNHHRQFISIAGSLQQPDTGAEGFAVPPQAAAACPAAAGGPQNRKQREQAQAQVQQRQQQPALERKPIKKKGKAAEEGQQAVAPPPPAQQQQQQQPVGKKSKKEKRKQDSRETGKPSQPQQQNGDVVAATAAPPPAPVGKAKDKKRKADAAAAAAAAAANGGLKKQQQKKKKQKDNA